MDLIRFFALLVIMLSAGARAFVNPASRPAAFRRVVARAMSSEDGPDTSIVDICQQKIQDALEAKSVKVTGTFLVCCSFSFPTFYSISFENLIC